IMARNTGRFFSEVNATEMQRILGSETMTKMKAAFESSGKSFDEWLRSLNVTPGTALSQEQLALRVIPYRALVELRKFVGQRIANPSLLDDAPRGELKSLYKAITKDAKAAAMLQDAAIGAGGVPTIGAGRAAGSALKAFEDANSTWKNGIDLWEDTLRFVTKKMDTKGVTNENLFDSFARQARTSPSSIVKLHKEFIKAGRKHEWADVADAVLTRMATARPSSQDAAGAKFSFPSFLTQWNQLPKRSREALFAGRMDTASRGKLIDMLNSVARVAEKSRTVMKSEGSGLIPPGLAGGAAYMASGDPFLAVTSAMFSLWGANRGAWALTRPAFVKHVLLKTYMNKTMAPSALMGQISKAAEEDPEIAKDMDDVLRALRIMMQADIDTEAQTIIQRERQ
ncbi:MAG: hypothetical protein ACYSW8_33385, partial [Planctomycetota bacterium]